MKKYFSKDFLKTVTGLALAIVLGLGINFAVADWQGPTTTPPGGNPDNLITTGASQVKSGKLTLYGTGVLTNSGTDQSYGLKVGDESLAYSNPPGCIMVDGFCPHGGIWAYGPLQVWGNSGLYGDVFVGPKVNASESPVVFEVAGRAGVSNSLKIGTSDISDADVLTVNESSDVKLKVDGTSLVGDVKIGSTSDNDLPEYTLHLEGNTNIGMGDYCTLEASALSAGCPSGFYLYAMDGNLGKCKSFNPDSTPNNLGNCSGAGFVSSTSLSQSVSNQTHGNISDSNIPYDDDSNGEDNCNANVSVTTTVSGGIPPYTYSWKVRNDPSVNGNGDHYWQANGEAMKIEIDGDEVLPWEWKTIGSGNSTNGGSLSDSFSIHVWNPGDTWDVEFNVTDAAGYSDTSLLNSVGFWTTPGCN